MLPKPFSNKESDAFAGVPTSSLTGIPAISATAMLTTISAMNGSSLSLMINNSSTAMDTAASVNRPAVSCCSQCTNEVMDPPGRGRGLGWWDSFSGTARRRNCVPGR